MMAQQVEWLAGIDDNGLESTFEFMADRYLEQTIQVSRGRYPQWMDSTVDVVRSFEPQSVVDVGCGPGYFLRRLKSELPDADIHGVDYSAAMLKQVPSGVSTVHRRLSHWISDGGRNFDTIVMTFVLRDQPDPRAVVEQVKRRLNPGGHLVVLETHTPPGWRRPGFQAYFHQWLPWRGRTALAPDWEGPEDKQPYRWLSESHRVWDEARVLPDAFSQAGYRRWQSHRAPDDVVMLWSAECD